MTNTGDAGTIVRTQVSGHGGVVLSVRVARAPDVIPMLLPHGQASSSRVWE